MYVHGRCVCVRVHLCIRYTCIYACMCMGNQETEFSEYVLTVKHIYNPT